MNTRGKALLFGLATVIFFPFIFLYLVAYHHFEDKQHIYATVLEYIEGVIVNILYGLTGKKGITIFDIEWIDFWYRKGVYINKYTSLSKKDIKELENILWLRYLSFEKTNKKVEFFHLGNVYNDSYTFKNDNTFNFEMFERTYKPSIEGVIDEKFVDRIKEWKEK